MAKTKRQAPARAANLTRGRIGAAALALIDRDGLAGFSARRLADALGCEAMSLYHHVENMDDVLDLVVDQLFASAPAPPSHDARKGLAAMAQTYLAMAERHPNAFALVATRRWRTPNALAAAEASMNFFQSLGATPREALRRARILGAYMNGAGLALSAWLASSRRVTPSAAPASAPAAALSADAVRADLDVGLKRLLDVLSA